MSKKVNRKLHELERRHVEALEEIEDMKKRVPYIGSVPGQYLHVHSRASHYGQCHTASADSGMHSTPSRT